MATNNLSGEESEVEDFSWRFLTVCEEGSKVKKVGFSATVFADDEWLPVRNLSRPKDGQDTKSVTVVFSKTITNKGNTLKGKDNKFTATLQEYLSSGSTSWAKLENISHVDNFVAKFNEVQRSETRQESDDSYGEELQNPSCDTYKFIGTPDPKKRVGVITPKAGHSKGSRNTAKIKTTDRISKRPPSPGSLSDSDSEDDTSVKQSKKKKCASTRTSHSSSSSKKDFRTEVELLRNKHPDLENAADDQVLNKTESWWRKQHVPAVTGLDARAINSSRGVHLTVATLSKRCYRMAVGVMNKWAKGTYHRQPTTAVTQTLFYCLVGLKDEQDVFNVLQEFHIGSLKSKKEFDQKVNGIKLSKQGGDACQLLRAEKQRLCETVRNLTEEKTAAEAENQRLSEEIDNLKKELDKSKKDLDKYQKDKGQGEDAEKQRLCETVRNLTEEKTAAEAENQRLSGEIDNLKKELDKSKKDLDKYQKDKEPHEATEPAPKSRKTLHNWEGKTITMGKMVAVVYSSPRQVYYGRVADIAEREGEQVVMVDFFKKARKSLVANGEREPVPPTFILDTDVQVVKNGETLSLSQGEDGRLKKKETQFWATGRSP
ncbi:uncharacterized protein LOC144923975 [Branchiostoma floridae x Branchiostoma belcheri]